MPVCPTGPVGPFFPMLLQTTNQTGADKLFKLQTHFRSLENLPRSNIIAGARLIAEKSASAKKALQDYRKVYVLLNGINGIQAYFFIW